MTTHHAGSLGCLPQEAALVGDAVKGFYKPPKKGC